MTDTANLPHLALLLAPVVVFVATIIVLSAAGAALLGANRTKLHHWERGGNDRVRRLVELTADRAQPVAAIRLARLVATVLATIFATRAVFDLGVDTTMLAVYTLAAIGVAIILDMGPRVSVLARPERAALRLLPVVEACMKVFQPVIRSIEWMGTAHARLFYPEVADDLSAHEELREAVDLLHREGEVVKADRDMVGGVLDLAELTLADVMIHRTKMETVNIDQPPRDLVRQLLTSPFTRMPLWRDKPENIIGVVHARDLARAYERVGGDADRLDILGLASPPWFVPETTGAGDQLKAFLKRKIHMALVVDEYGDVQGLVTLEDILEEIVGDIADEQDVVVQGVRPYPDGSASVDGQVPIRDLNRMMDWRLPDEEATTIAGLVIHETRMIPDPGQSFTFHGFRFHVLRKQRNRITALKVTPVDALRQFTPPGRP